MLQFLKELQLLSTVFTTFHNLFTSTFSNQRAFSTFFSIHCCSQWKSFGKHRKMVWEAGPSFGIQVSQSKRNNLRLVVLQELTVPCYFKLRKFITVQNIVCSTFVSGEEDKLKFIQGWCTEDANHINPVLLIPTKLAGDSTFCCWPLSKSITRIGNKLLWSGKQVSYQGLVSLFLPGFHSQLET